MIGLNYEVIRERDEAFSLDGNLCDNPNKINDIAISVLEKIMITDRYSLMNTGNYFHSEKYK